MRVVNYDCIERAFGLCAVPLLAVVRALCTCSIALVTGVTRDTARVSDMHDKEDDRRYKPHVGDRSTIRTGELY